MGARSAWAALLRRIDLEDVFAALAGAVQILSTDSPAPVPHVDYVVEIPGGTPSRCNPKSAPSECTSEAIEDPAFLAEPGP